MRPRLNAKRDGPAIAQLCITLLPFVLMSTPGQLRATDEWQPAQGQLLTRWAKDVQPDRVWPEYPRPQLVRREWHNLNGLWDYAITAIESDSAPRQYDGKILVPFCIESALSGVKKPVTPAQALWYHRTFEVPGAWSRDRVLLHFGAVDWEARVWVNDRPLGTHRGGYTPFTCDITDALAPDGPQKLVVKVVDPTDQGWQPRGKQVLKPEGIWYTAVTGIWQTVWLEPVPASYVRALEIVPDVDRSTLGVEVDAVGGGHVRVEVRDEGRIVAQGDGPAGSRLTLAIPDAKLWSPDEPHLYDLNVSLLEDGRPGDAVQSYAGMRKVALGTHQGHTRILLNGKPLFQYGPLDQGWWPDGLYTAPTDAALAYDLEVLKGLGMNLLRKHVKIEPDRLYYHCDRLGLLVWQDMPSGDRYIGGNDPDIKRHPDSGENFERELKSMIDALRNHPSLVMWVVYNEGWGQWDTARLARWAKEYDTTRLVNSASGWTDRGVGDVIDIHAYPGPAMSPPEDQRASVLGEFGGLGWPVEGHLWWNKQNWGYRTYGSQAELQENYNSVVGRLWPLIGQGLSAAVYTQTSDVEGEVNGLLTYDRARLKLKPNKVAALHRSLYRPPPQIREIVPTSVPHPQTWRYTLEQPDQGWTSPEFDDSRWRTGQGMFGRQGTPGVRLGTPWTSSDIWLRREFRLDEVPAGNLHLRVYHDEDAEVYINGVPAGAFRQWVTSFTLARVHDDALRALKPGKNILAVHCHQTDGGQGVDAGLCLVIDAERDDCGR